MFKDEVCLNRRALLTGSLAALAASPAWPGPAWAKPRPSILTPGQIEGPFYPVDFPPDTDNDLVRVSGRAAQAMGEVLRLGGRVLDRRGEPVRGAAVEIWQCDSRGIYRHPGSPNRRAFDDAFQGYGRTEVDATGAYAFRTIRPVPYPGRAPHIHVAVRVPHRGMRFVTQMYVAGEPLNARDGLLGSVRNAAARRSLVVPLTASTREAGAADGAFDIVLDL